MLTEDIVKLRDKDSEEARLFRRRFRIPFALFETIVQWTKEWLGVKDEDILAAAADTTGRKGPAIALKVLGVLRILGRGTCADGIKELSGISETAMLCFFHRFCRWAREEIYPKFVHPPKTLEEFNAAMGPYIALALNGCIGSTDAVHVHWGMCPSEFAVLFTGKEGFPTIVFNVTCTHDGAAIHVGTGTYGSCNDKTLIRFDEFIADLRTLDVFTEVEYQLYTASGEFEWVKGVYVIVDGGYHRWRATMSASSHEAHPDFIRYVLLLCVHLWSARFQPLFVQPGH